MTVSRWLPIALLSCTLVAQHPAVQISGKNTMQGASSITGASLTADFTLSVVPSAISVTQGNTASTVVTVTSVAGFNSAVTLAASLTGITGVTAAFSSNPITPAPNGSVTSTLTLTATGAAPLITCVTFTVTGTAGALSHVSSPCLSVVAQATQSFAALPTEWVNSDVHAGVTTGNGICHPPGGTYDETKSMPGDFACSAAGLVAAKTYQVTHNGGEWMLLQISPSCKISVSTATNGCFISFPTGDAVNKCLVIQSSTPNPDGRTVCSHGLPGYPSTAIRNPLCNTTSYNDAANMWQVEVDDSTAANGSRGICFPDNVDSSGAGISHHILLSDLNIYPKVGTAQSTSTKHNTGSSIQVHGDSILVTKSWVHGWDPGDPGQSGTSPNWTMTGTLTSNGASPNSTLTYTSGNAFGMDFADATSGYGWPSVITGQANALILDGAGAGYTILTHDPTASNTSLIVSGVVAAGSHTYSLTNPRTGYETGSGDDFGGIDMSCTNCYEGYNYINKLHKWASEAHAVSGGNTTGPMKLCNHDWIEAPSIGVFQGGSDADSGGGPANNIEIGPCWIGRDLNVRFLSASSGHSPHPPFGCGPLDVVAAHNTCAFNWAEKNDHELKFDNKVVIHGVILDGIWADGQSGYAQLSTVRTASGGEVAGIFDPLNSGVPLTRLSNIRWQDFWIRNAPQGIQTSSRALNPGNGGGLSQPMSNIDFINGVFTNVGDDAQWGSPGNYLAYWVSTGQIFLATMSRSTGVAHAVVQPMKVANYDPGTNNVGTYKSAISPSSIVKDGSNNVTIKLSSLRSDPRIFDGTLGYATITNQVGWNSDPATPGFQIASVAKGASTTVCSQDVVGAACGGGNPQCLAAGAIGSAQPQPCIRSDGTFGDTFVYNDAFNTGTPAGTLCSTLATCNALPIHLVMDTLAYKYSDIAVGNGVYVHNCTGGSNPASYLAGSSSFNAAVSPTSASGTGNDVYYANSGSDDSSGTVCQVENSQGWPSNMSWQHVTEITQKAMGVIGVGGASSQYRYNSFFSNVFWSPTGTGSEFTCLGVAGSGVQSGCWDASTFRFFDNVMGGQPSCSAWPAVDPTNPPGGPPANACPATITCSGATANPTCQGWQHYMSGVAFPTGNCTWTGDATNCPLMTAPWSANFSLSFLTPVGSYATEGFDITTLENAFTSTQYTCPTGASCGTHGPYPD